MTLFLPLLHFLAKKIEIKKHLQNTELPAFAHSVYEQKTHNEPSGHLTSRKSTLTIKRAKQGKPDGEPFFRIKLTQQKQ